MAKYFNLDVSIVRLLTVLLTVFVGGGLIAYIVCALVLPEEPETIVEEATQAAEALEEPAAEE